MRTRQTIGVMLCAISLSLFTGCALFWVGAGAAAGAGAVMYATGELTAEENVSLDTAREAANTALQDLGYTITKRESAENEATLTARTADDQKITVHLEQVSSEVTEVAVRVGLTGNEDVSRRILERIRANY